MTKYRQSSRLNNVHYDIRGPILDEANRMEAMGYRILKLNIGNPAPFGFEAPDAIMMDIIRHLPETQGYSDSHGLYSARTAIVQHYQNHGIMNLDTESIYLGNGVSELIPMTLQALCETGDEILVPMPDYPLWTASTALVGGKPVHYLCDEENNWYPDIEDIKSKITERTKGIVVINPNNPTGAVYPRSILKQIVDLAREHGLVVFSDEIYEKITYDGALYLFPKIDIERFDITDDEQFALDLLKSQKILFSHGRAFNWKDPDHFRLVYLPDTQTLTSALERLGNFMADYKQKH